MDENKIISEAHEILREYHKNDRTGHDYWHVIRVYNNALHIQSVEGGDLFVVRLAALFHDFIDYKLTDDENGQIDKVKVFLRENGVDEKTTGRIIHAMRAVSFKGGNNPVRPESLEDEIVQDADRLDALGAVGIARTFIYGGSKGHEMYDPKTGARENISFEAYKDEDNTMINHFYEKLLKLRSLMNTDTARDIAEDRHVFMENYLEQFYAEWDGKK
ncbi:MAG TPA: HD domain-containing protein [Candidatus Salinicoccus stercoripullorum]|uniref:HD domain-containing protein n=1 Tax=Candidatus Salinicoccus stercoripullorum TaxID=2838756 RepID=A0A9D1QF60_9STAP|nr:HD domain-containing protein [Candidatus Salinicoccus stercoripullorum]